MSPRVVELVKLACDGAKDIDALNGILKSVGLNLNGRFSGDTQFHLMITSEDNLVLKEYFLNHPVIKPLIASGYIIDTLGQIINPHPMNVIQPRSMNNYLLRDVGRIFMPQNPKN